MDDERHWHTPSPTQGPLCAAQASQAPLSTSFESPALLGNASSATHSCLNESVISTDRSDHVNLGEGRLCDSTQPSSTPRQSIWSKKFWRPWTLEILSALIALGLVAAIICIIAHFDGQMKPEWRYSINLNTVVALLSTLARALTLVTAAEVLGQAKWLWFSQQQSRPVSDLEQFDKASRGWIGSLQLLPIVRGNTVALGSCLIVILSLAIGPFTQQAIKSTTCPLNSKQSRASIPIAHHMGFPGGDWAPYRFAADPFDITLPGDMKGAMFNGLVNLMGNTSALSAFCPTGNCTFPTDEEGITYSSIGLCSACIDTTPFIANAGPDLYYPEGYGGNPENNITVFPNWTLPNGMWIYLAVHEPILNVSTEDDLEWASSAFSQEFNESLAASISNVTFLSFTQAPCSNVSGTLNCPHNVTSCAACETWDFVASSCSLYPCLRNYQGVVREGELIEKVVSTLPARFNTLQAENFWHGNFTALKNPCSIGGRRYNAEDNYSGLSRSGRRFIPITVAGTNYTSPEECVYSLERYYSNGIYTFLSTTLYPRGCVWAGETNGEVWCEPAWWLTPFFHSRHATFETLSAAMDKFATIVSNRFRTTGSSSYDPYQAESAKGVVIETELCIVFNWEWLLLPIILVAVNVLLLGYMIAQSLCLPSQPVWKTSILPFLFCNIKRTSTLIEEDPRVVMDMEVLGRQAKQTRVRWENGAGAGFVWHEEGGESERKHHDIDLDSLLAHED